jgi:hypothetical protein
MKTNWTVTGRIMVNIPLPEFGASLPLSNVEVNVSARKFGNNLWNSWDKVRTDANGRFTVTNKKDKDERQFKIEVKFEDDDLAVYGDERGGVVTTAGFRCRWLLAHQDGGGTKRNAGTTDLGNITFADGEPAINEAVRHDFVPVRSAGIWHIYKSVIAFMKTGGVPFTSKIHIQYPQDGALDDSKEASYANPSNKMIYLVKNTKKDQYTLSTMVHELMHLWMYGHCTGEIRLAPQTLIHGGTHDARQEKPFVAFHEGFAEWAKNRLLPLIFSNAGTFFPYGYEDTGVPLLRSKLNAIGATSLNEMSHYEEAWNSVFNLLTVDNLHELDLNTNSIAGEVHAERNFVPPANLICASPIIGFTGLLRMFLKDKDKGHRDYIEENEMNVEYIIGRACDMIDNLNGLKETLKKLLNPANTEQPHDLLCRNLLTSSHVPGKKRIGMKNAKSAVN